MNYSEIIKLNGKKVSIDTLNELKKSVYVESVECLGDSGIYYGYTWYSVVLSPAYEMSGNIIIGVYLKKGGMTVEDVINKLSLTTYINLIDSGHSVAYCKANQLNDNLKRRYVKSINGESRYSIQIYI